MAPESWSRSPHVYTVGTHDRDLAEADLPDRFLALACLTYGSDHPGRIARARALLAARPDLAAASIHVAAATGDVEAATRWLARDPAGATAEGGPHALVPPLYLAYSRVVGPGGSHVAVARMLLEAGADPDAGFLWDGLSWPFTALTGAFGGGEGGPNQPPHPAGLDLARLLLARWRSDRA